MIIIIIDLLPSHHIVIFLLLWCELSRRARMKDQTHQKHVFQLFIRYHCDIFSYIFPRFDHVHAQAADVLKLNELNDPPPRSECKQLANNHMYMNESLYASRDYRPHNGHFRIFMCTDHTKSSHPLLCLSAAAAAVTSPKLSLKSRTGMCPRASSPLPRT